MRPNSLDNLNRHQDLFDDSATEIHILIHDINAAYDALLQNSVSRSLHERFSSIRTTVHCKVRWMENNWLVQRLHRYRAILNEVMSFYEVLIVCTGQLSSSYIHSEIFIVL